MKKSRTKWDIVRQRREWRDDDGHMIFSHASYIHFTLIRYEFIFISFRGCSSYLFLWTKELTRWWWMHQIKTVWAVSYYYISLLLIDDKNLLKPSIQVKFFIAMKSAWENLIPLKIQLNEIPVNWHGKPNFTGFSPASIQVVKIAWNA
jgi:hypothetical protein